MIIEVLKGELIYLLVIVVLFLVWEYFLGKELGVSDGMDGRFENVDFYLIWIRRKRSCLVCCFVLENNVVFVLE